MPAAVPYFDVIRQMPNAFNYRLRLVTHAPQHGMKAAARDFRTTVPTVRKWLRRYPTQGLKGLRELSRAPHSCPHKIVGELAQRVVELRRPLPPFGARRLQREWELPLGHVAIERILREQGLLRPRRRKYQKKQDLAALKATWALFQQISADTKDLDDIAHYWPQRPHPMADHPPARSPPPPQPLLASSGLPRLSSRRTASRRSPDPTGGIPSAQVSLCDGLLRSDTHLGASATYSTWSTLRRPVS